MSYLVIKNLNKQFDNVTAIDTLNLDVQKGEFIALLGPSGCGKSTLLRILAGLETPSSGAITIDGIDVTHLSPSKRNISMVFQSYALFPHLSVKENILFGLKARGVKKLECESRLRHVLELVSLTEQQHRLPGQLSGGQRQRVALARSIVSKHPICLMDEPLSNLDAKLRTEMRAEIRELQQSLGLTLIYVTHDQVEAMSMADRIVLLSQGKVQQVGTPQDLYNQPQNTFTARFIGSPAMNVFSLPNCSNEIGVRPENIMLSDEGISGQVIHTDYHGDSTLLKVRLLNDSDVFVKVERWQKFKKGQLVNLTWDPSDQHEFCKENGYAVIQK
ncbi:ABC transporter ATP-binding protein [Vibrio sp. TH_r3]|uniref:ABC transporter ATP-binding protein n=1 Tax=Vibrio sp. TH_r3 TaxID=3082084 RepID=UPI0029553E08|nr:ABC transporter ATP-binding protein [Vibrio sp. TH_r3]MDV7105562.1 ABC transporter ATP-binding protein [Vibrio sp. TH_r3]